MCMLERGKLSNIHVLENKLVHFSNVFMLERGKFCNLCTKEEFNNVCLLERDGFSNMRILLVRKR